MLFLIVIFDVKFVDVCILIFVFFEVFEDVFVDRGFISCSSLKRIISLSVVKFFYMYYKIMII